MPPLSPGRIPDPDTHRSPCRVPHRHVYVYPPPVPSEVGRGRAGPTSSTLAHPPQGSAFPDFVSNHSLVKKFPSLLPPLISPLSPAFPPLSPPAFLPTCPLAQSVCSIFFAVKDIVFLYRHTTLTTRAGFPPSLCGNGPSGTVAARPGHPLATDTRLVGQCQCRSACPTFQHSFKLPAWNRPQPLGPPKSHAGGRFLSRLVGPRLLKMVSEIFLGLVMEVSFLSSSGSPRGGGGGWVFLLYRVSSNEPFCVTIFPTTLIFIY